ncbi:MAG: DNA internalization-related competence protein ComEC/Rec2 [Thermodesulfobacteriota bacterium]
MKTVQTDVYLRPVIPLLVAFMLGITAGVRMPGHEIPAGMMAAVCFGAVIACILRRRGTGTPPLLLFLALGYLSIQPWTHPEFPPDHVTHFIGGRQRRIFGTVHGAPIRGGRYLNVIVEARRLYCEKGWRPVRGKVRVTCPGEPPEMATGDFIAFDARLMSIRNFNNPGGFDYKRLLAFQGVFARAYAVAGHLEISRQQSGNPVSGIIDRARQQLMAFIRATVPKEQAPIVGALVVGNLSPVPPEDWDVFSRAGIGHILSISGLHVSIVGGFFFFLFSRLLGRVDWLLWRGWGKKASLALAFVPVMIYGTLAGMSPATQRSVIMAAVFLAALIIGRRQDGLNVLAIAALLILVAHPPLLYSVSFQLSFAAVGAIVYGLMKTGWPRIAGGGFWMQAGKRVGLFFLISLLAIVGTLPLGLYYFNQVSLIALLANCLAIPAIGWIVVPLSLTAMLLYPVSLAAAGWCLRISARVLEHCLNWIRLMADWPFAAVHTVTPNEAEILGFYLFFAAVLSLPGYRNHPGRTASGWNLTHPAIPLALAVLILAADCGYWIRQRFRHPDLKVTFLDVGAGNSALLEFPGSHTMLIDGGGFPDNAVFDVGQRIVAPFLWRQKIRTIDTLVLTHADSDHLNGLVYIVRHFAVKEIWTNGATPGTRTHDNFMEAVHEKAIFMPDFCDLQRERQIQGVRVEWLHPPRKMASGNGNGGEINNNSIVLRICYGRVCLLFPGDIMASAEGDLLGKKETRLNSSILLAPHHGSKTSSTRRFLEAVRPELVVVSSRARGGARLPHPEVADRYRQMGLRILGTDGHGAVTIRTDGTGYAIMTEIPEG